MDTSTNEQTAAADTSLSDQMIADSKLPFSKDADKEAEEQAEIVPGEAPEEVLDTTFSEKEATEKKKADADKDEEAGDDKADTAEDIDDAKLLAALNKRTGKDYKSLDDLKPAAEAGDTTSDDDKALAAEQTRSEAIEFGKKNNLFTQSQYDQNVAFSIKDPSDVVQEDFVARLMAEDPDLNPDDAADLFNEFYHIHEDEDSIKYKQAQKLISDQYELLKKTQYGAIVDVTGQYGEYQKNTERAISYKNQVDTLFQQKIPTKFDFTIQGEVFSFPVDTKNKQIAEIITGIKNDYLTIDMMNSTLDQTGKVDEASLLKEISKDLKAAVLENMVSAIAESYADSKMLKTKQGRKGFIDLTGETADTRSEKLQPLSLSDQMMKEDGYMLPAK